MRCRRGSKHLGGAGGWARAASDPESAFPGTTRADSPKHPRAPRTIRVSAGPDAGSGHRVGQMNSGCNGLKASSSWVISKLEQS